MENNQIKDPTTLVPSVATQAIVPNQNVQSAFSFSNKRPADPLPPLVQAYYTKETGILEVSSVIFLAEKNIDPKSITVTYGSNEEGQPQFYINYNAPEVMADTFYGFQVNFSLKFESQPEVIETFVNDKDPALSRGTLTTVQP